MSDDEYDYHYSDESDDAMDDASNADEDEGFIYSSDEGDNQADDMEITLENNYYEAKGQRDTEEEADAIQTFESVIAMEKEELGGDSVGIWTFKSLKQMVKLHMRMGDFQKAMEVYQRLLGCISDPNCQGVSPNAMEKGINGMLDRVTMLFQGSSTSANPAEADKPTSSKGRPHDLARLVYDSTLSLFHPRHGSCPNERLWFKTNLKYGQLLYENSETAKLQTVISDLLRTSEDIPPEDHDTTSATSTTRSSASSSTHLMEIYALQIQLYSRLKDHKKLRSIYDRAMQVRGGIPHPRTLALIQELGGKMHMSSRDYALANTAFFQAFKSYDEAGDVARLRCLKYLVLASMLHASSINPFDSQEVRPYKNDPEIVAMTNLVDAFHDRDIQRFERILKRNEGRIMNDEFIREHIEDLLRTIRTQVLMNVIVPYTRISLGALSRELNGIDRSEVERLLVPLILDGKLEGRIDQVKGILVKSVPVHGGLGSNEEKEEESSHGDSGGSAGGTSSKVKNEMAIPEWGGNTVPVRTIDAIQSLMEELETLTKAITTSAATGPSPFLRKS